MEITYLGHSSFRIKGKTATVITDPYSDSIGLKFPKVSADIVTVSHIHDDHNNVQAVSDVKHVFNGPGEYEMMGVSFIGLPTYHDDKKGEVRGKNIVFVIEIDNLRLAHLGDLGHKLSEKQLEDMGQIDVLMIPVGGFYTISQDVAVEVAQGVECPVTIPMHYKVDGLSKDLAEKISGYEDFIVKMGLPKQVLPKLNLTKDTIGENERVVVLEKI
ncbi:MBL fold metallo-hydrolase [Candidatus Woesebacteria bacterium]|nr:MAG: MBL fold metallo-hydrolase [Candidatus Woesebacteria bacterium]